MTLPAADQLLSRPPTPKVDGTYDSRALDKWFQKIYLLLGLVVAPPNSFNLPSTTNTLTIAAVTLEGRVTVLESAPKPIAIGGIYVSIVSTNPATLLGYGTWAAFGAGRFLVGIDAGDADFDTVEETGGAKTHKHSVDVAAINSGVPSATVDAVIAGGTTAVGDGTHTHSVDPAVVDSEIVSNVPPYCVVYFWKRTA